MEFSQFSFSIIECNIKEVIRNIGIFFIDHNKINDTYMKVSTTKCEKWINPAPGGLKSLFFVGQISENKTIFLSNLSDGYTSGVHMITKKVKARSISITMTNSSLNGAFMFMVIDDQNTTERVVYQIKESQWIFYQKGTALPYEDTERYIKEKPSKKMDNELLIKYLQHEGIDFIELCAKEFKGIVVDTLSHNQYSLI